MTDGNERRPPPETKLGDYVGIGMAAILLGRSPEQTGIVYDMINEYEIPVYKVGGVSLVSFDDLAACSGGKLTRNAAPLWPQEIGGLPLKSIFSRTELASLLNVSVGTIHRWATSGKITAIDLSEWNMHSLYYYGGPIAPQLPVEFRMGGRQVKVSLHNGELHIDIWTEEPVGAICFDLEPTKAWFREVYTNNTHVLVQVHDKE